MSSTHTSPTPNLVPFPYAALCLLFILHENYGFVICLECWGCPNKSRFKDGLPQPSRIYFPSLSGIIANAKILKAHFLLKHPEPMK